jgi:hypothetical protein
VSGHTAAARPVEPLRSGSGTRGIVYERPGGRFTDRYITINSAQRRRISSTEIGELLSVE